MATQAERLLEVSLAILGRAASVRTKGDLFDKFEFSDKSYVKVLSHERQAYDRHHRLLQSVKRHSSE